MKDVSGRRLQALEGRLMLTEKPLKARQRPRYGSSTGVLEKKCCESVSFRDIYIFYEKTCL